MSEEEYDQAKGRGVRQKTGSESEPAGKLVGGQIRLPAAVPRRRHARISEQERQHIEHSIQELPPWGSQMTLRGFLVGEFTV